MEGGERESKVNNLARCVRNQGGTYHGRTRDTRPDEDKGGERDGKEGRAQAIILN